MPTAHAFPLKVETARMGEDLHRTRALRRDSGSADSTEVTLQRVDSKIDEILRKLDEWSPQVHQAHEQMVARLLKGIQGSLSTDLASTGDVNLSGLQTISSENLLAQAPAAEAGTSSQGSKQMRHRQPPLRHVTEEVVLETDLSGSRCSSAGGNSAKGKRRSSGPSLLALPKKNAKGSRVPIASVDMSTFTEQVNAKLRQDAGHLVHSTEKRLIVPSMNQMNSAFLHSMVDNNHDFSVHSSRSSSRRPSLRLSINDNSQMDFKDPMEHSEVSDNEEEKLRDREIERLASPTPQEEELSHIVPLPGEAHALELRLPKKTPPTMLDMANQSQAKIMDDFKEFAASGMHSGNARERTTAASNIFQRLRPCVLYFLAAFCVLASCAPITVSAAGLTSSVGFGFIIMSSNLYTVAAISCVFFVRRALKSDDFTLALDKLHKFVVTFEIEWGQVTGLEWRMYALAWVLMVAGFGAALGLEEWKSSQEAWQVNLTPGVYDIAAITRVVCGVLSFIAFTMCSAAVVLADYVQSHLLLGLDKSLDCWCCSVLDGDFSNAVDSWNCMQALLKAIGKEIASGFLAAQTIGAIGVIYVLASSVTFAFQSGFQLDIAAVESLSSLPLLLLFALNLRVCSHGAALTEKCRAIPAFVNQIPSPDADPIDLDRTYLVRFIADSSAGFFVKDIKLTREMFMKNFIMVGGILSGFVGVLSRFN